MPNIQEFEGGNLSLRPTETGVTAREGVARRVGSFFNQEASAVQMLASETSRLGSQTARLGSETAALGAERGAGLADTGRRLGSAIDAAGTAAVKYLDHQQISQGSAAFARLMDQKTKEWNNIAARADPNDPTVASRFMESLEPELEKFKEHGFYTENGQKWAEAHVDALRKHMADTTMGTMSTLAGQAAKQNVQQTVNSLSSAAHDDPSNRDFAIAALKSGLDGMIATSPNLSATQVGQIRTELQQDGIHSILNSAALGYIAKTGQLPPWINDPKYSPYINGQELKQFAQAAKYYQRLGESEDKAARAQREHEAKLDFNAKVNSLEVATMPKNAGDKPTLPNDYWSVLRDLSTHPGAALEPGRLKTMVENGERLTERLNKPEPLGRVSHDTTVDLIKRMRAIDETRLTSNDDIYKAYAAGKLSTPDFNFLTKEFKEMKTPEGEALSRDRTIFFKQYAGAIAGRSYDPVIGSPKLYAAEMDARRQEEDLRKKGLDPHLAYDPRSEYFFGKTSNISKYAGSMQGDLATRAATPGAPAKVTEGGDDGLPPAPLRGIAALEWSPKRQQYRDAASGKLYSRDGTEVKP